MEPMTDAAETLRKKREIMDAMQIARARMRLPHHGVVLRYPDTDAQLRVSHPMVWEAAYGTHTTPIRCQVDTLRVEMLKRHMPCRLTHSSVRDLVGPRAARGVGGRLRDAIRRGPASAPCGARH
eukprot:8604633-Pyramimonas_sp.AAC.1